MSKITYSATALQSSALNALRWSTRIGLILVATGLLIRFGLELPQQHAYPGTNVVFFSGLALSALGLAGRRFIAPRSSGKGS